MGSRQWTGFDRSVVESRYSRRQVLQSAAALGLAAPSLGVGLTRAAGATAAQEQVSLRFQSWRLADTVSGPLYERWIEEYQEQNPNVSIDIDPVPFAQRLDSFTAQALAGDPPDIVGLTTGDVVQVAGLGQVENLDAFYEQDEAFVDEFVPLARDLSQHDGSVYALSHELSSGDAVWYNVDLLQGADIDPEDALSTWDSYVEAAERLTGDGQFGMALRGADVTGTLAAMWPFLMQKAGPLVTDDDIRANLCSPGSLEVFERYVALYTVHGVTPSPIDLDFTTQMQMFASERTAFLHQGSWMKAIIEEENPDMEGRFLPLPLPLFEDGERYVTVDGMALMIGRGAQHPEAAWEFMKFITSREKQEENFELTGFMPSNSELVDSPMVQEDPIFGIYASQMAEYGVPRPRSVRANEIWTLVHTEFHNALLETKDAGAALEDACAGVEALLD